jgi:hypothetical protein
VPAAKTIERSHPLLAAKVHVAIALRILEAKKSKCHDAARENLKKTASRCLRSD